MPSALAPSGFGLFRRGLPRASTHQPTRPVPWRRIKERNNRVRAFERLGHRPSLRSLTFMEILMVRFTAQLPVVRYQDHAAVTRRPDDANQPGWWHVRTTTTLVTPPRPPIRPDHFHSDIAKNTLATVSTVTARGRVVDESADSTESKGVRVRCQIKTRPPP